MTILKKNHHSKRLQKSTVKKEWVKVIEISIQQSTPIIRFTTASTEYPLITSNHQTTCTEKKIHQTYLCIQNLC